MDKMQALHDFWSSFDLPAYDENTVPANAPYPRITYEAASDGLGGVLPLSASIWYWSMSWEEISQKAEEIAEYIENIYPPATKVDGGRMYITRETPFAQRMADPEPFIRRILLSVNVEFFTKF